jgi:hypothetical protein
MRVFNEWTDYLQQIIPANAPPIQIEECRRAFYAGGLAVYALMMQAVEPADHRECDQNLEALHTELLAISRDLAIPLDLLRKQRGN